MRAAPIFGIIFVLLTASCVGVKAPVPDASPQTAGRQAADEAEAPIASPAAPQSPAAPSVSTQGGAAPVEPAPPPATPTTATSPGQSAAKTAEPSAKALAKAAPPP